jgi:apolipoprotein N-acyltransferase
MLSFRFYDIAWAIPIGTLLVLIMYGFIFWFFSFISYFLASKTKLPVSIFQAVFILLFSLVHPLNFDWFKPELIFAESYLGINKYQFAIVLAVIIITQITAKLRYLWLIVLAFNYPNHKEINPINKDMKLVTTNITMDTKWQEEHQQEVFDMIYTDIDKAIKEHKKIVVLPESVFPLFLNTEDGILGKLIEKSRHIDIVVGGLYWDNGIPRNSTYIFKNGKVQVINKVVLVPFGEQNPLPEWASKFVNQIFFKEGMLDYKASDLIGDYTLRNKKYRNAICYEATSEQLYAGEPKNMIAISNNGWFQPSIQPTLQRLLLEYYSLKYGTTIYHSVNMSPSYIISDGQLFFMK